MARHDTTDRRLNDPADNDDAFMELFHDKDVTFDEMLHAFDREETVEREQPSARNAQSAITQEVLGIDEEVKIKKTRKPVVKLDESRLTSAAGVPKLQKIAKSKLKFKGKGHEFSDVALLLRTYQLWLHDLYPRAKFKDGLIILEKLGHTKSVQRLRCDWIAESKPRLGDEAESAAEDDSAPVNLDQSADLPHEKQSSDDMGNHLGEADVAAMPVPPKPSCGSRDEHPEDDELDALLAEEQEMFSAAPTAHTARSAQRSLNEAQHAEHDYSRDEDIMREMEMWDT